MGDGDLDGRRWAAAGSIDSRSAHRPVHGWLSGAGGTPAGEMSSSGQVEKGLLSVLQVMLSTTASF